MQFALFTVALFTSLATVSLATAQPVERMAWLAGCWRGDFGEPGTVEQWLQPAGATMLGVSRTVRHGKTAEYEFMQLRQLPTGVLAFVPQPSGRAPTIFQLMSMSEFEAVFENPEHDFPQRITYSRPEESRLLVRIEGNRNGSSRRIEFNFSRASCEAPAAAAVPK